MAQDSGPPSRSGSACRVVLCARCRDKEGGREDKPGGLFVDRNRLSANCGAGPAGNPGISPRTGARIRLSCCCCGGMFPAATPTPPANSAPLAVRRGCRAEISRRGLPEDFSCAMIRGSVAGWSSQAARRAHNPKVVGSNPAPATSKNKGLRAFSRALFVCAGFRASLGVSDFARSLGHHIQLEPPRSPHQRAQLPGTD